MSLANVSPQDLTRLLHRPFGFRHKTATNRKGKGSHQVWIKRLLSGKHLSTTVIVAHAEVRPGTLNEILFAAGISVPSFTAARLGRRKGRDYSPKTLAVHTDLKPLQPRAPRVPRLTPAK